MKNLAIEITFFLHQTLQFRPTHSHRVLLLSCILKSLGELLSALSITGDHEKYARLNGTLGGNCSKNNDVVYSAAVTIRKSMSATWPI